MVVIDPPPTPQNPNPHNPLRAGEYTLALKELSNIHWEFRPMGIEQIDERVKAIKQIHGRFPDVIFVDNLMNMVSNPTDYSGQMTMVRDLDTLARAASSHIVVLHHTHETTISTSAPPFPQAVWEIHGRVGQFPRLILTMAAAADQATESAHLMVAPVKNTNGPSDRTGKTYVDYMISTPSARIAEV